MEAHACIKGEGWETVRVNPDLVFYVPDRGKVVVEIVNPEKPKRFIGEIVYPHILGSLGLIGGAIFFVLPSPRTRKSERAMAQEMSLHRFLKKTVPDIAIYLNGNPEEVYRIFRLSIIDYQRMGKFY